MQFRFSYLKAMQAVGVLLRQRGESKRDNYTRVLKLLYMAERACIQQRGRPLLGDQVVAMKNGPVLSRVYNLIMDRDFQAPEWDRHFERCDRFDVRMINDVGNDELSPFEIGLLERICEENAAKDQWELIDEVHEFPEFKKNDPRKPGNPSGFRPIAFEDILEGLGLDPVERGRIQELARERANLDQLFSSSELG